MNTEKGSVKHRECTLPDPDKLPDPRTSSSSTRKAIAAWVRSIVCCILPSSAWPSLRRRAHHGSSSPHSKQQQEQPGIEIYLPPAICEASSQVSITDSSINDGWSIGSPSVTFVKTAELPVETLKTPNLYEPLLFEDSIQLLRIYKGTSSDPVEVTLELARLDDSSLKYEALSYVWGPSVTMLLVSSSFHLMSSQFAICLTHRRLFLCYLYYIEALQFVDRFEHHHLIFSLLSPTNVARHLSDHPNTNLSDEEPV